MMNKHRTIMTTAAKVLLAASLTCLTACGGCGKDNNAQNNPTTNNTAPNTAPNTTPNNTSPCPEGSANCPCKAGDVCDSGLMCDTNKCVGMTASGLKVSSEDARACDLLIEEGDTRVLGASGGDATKVAFKRRAPNVAVSFMSSSDAPIAPGAVTLESNGESSGFAITSVKCFDAAGKALDGVEITLD